MKTPDPSFLGEVQPLPNLFRMRPSDWMEFPSWLLDIRKDIHAIEAVERLFPKSFVSYYVYDSKWDDDASYSISWTLWIEPSAFGIHKFVTYWD